MKNDSGVSIYSEKYVKELQDEVTETQKKMKRGDQPIFDCVDALFASLKD